MRPHPALPALGVIAFTALAFAQDKLAPAPAAEPPPDIVPPSLFTVPEGLEVTVWARSPLLRNPTNMDVDAQGRIWVTEGVNYRKHAGRDPAGDRVVVLEDTNGNGRADKSTVFVQEPSFIAPLGMAVIGDQVIVSHAPDLIVYTRADPTAAKFNPRTDKRDVLLTGFNGQNHDHSLHSVTFGPDGKWYFNQGNSGAYFTDRSGKTFRVGSAYDPSGSGATKLFSWKPQDISGAASDDGHAYVGGFAMRMNPDGTGVEVIGYGFRNSYEQTVTSFGDVFQSDNDDTPACRTAFLLPYASAGFFSRDGTRTWQADRRPGQSITTAQWRQEDPGVMPAGDIYGAGAPTGMLSYEADALGTNYRGMIVACDAARNVLFGYLPQPDGAGYKLEHFDLLTTNKEQKLSGIDSLKGKISTDLKTWFRPSDAVVGPDGAIYVADWFDPRVGGHQDFDDGLKGAIYRIAPKGFKSVIPKFDLTTTDGQITALKSPAVNVRAAGFLRLRAQGAAAVAPVAALLNEENPFIRARAIWLLALLGDAGVGKVEALQSSPNAAVRVTAFRALRSARGIQNAHPAPLATDPSPAVRRELAVALRDVPLNFSRTLLLDLARGYDGKDRTYLEAWGIGCTGKEADIAAALAATQKEKDPIKWTPAYAQLVWRLTPASATGEFATRAAAKSLSDSDRLAATTALGFIPTREASTALLDLAQNSTEPVKTTALWWLLNYKNTRWNEFALDEQLKARGLYDPEKVVISESLVPPAPATKLPSAATIATLNGDAKHGAALAQACRLCHRIDGQGADYAPSLASIGSKQATEALITSIVDPSADIAHGYEGTEVILKDGKVIHGLVQSAGDPVVVQSTGGTTQLVPAAKIKTRRPLGRSLMLSAEQLGLSSQDVADVAAYLKTQ